MDKYEYNLKIDQIKSLCSEENYLGAAEIADTINWNKIRNVNALVKAGEVYEKSERYSDARDVLLLAYDRSPIGRMIIYRLAEVAVKMADYDSANAYYNEFVEIAPHDTLRYVLKYAIRRGQGAGFDELIDILEEFKDQEYTEEWAYELAYLYHKSGKTEKCIDACDELILWFGDGPYVERALELKMLYQPLTKVQEEKYRKFRLEREGITQIDSEAMIRAGEFAHETVEIPQVAVNSEKFNTVNLQEEIAKGMQQIMDATEKNEVADTMDNIKKIVEDIPYLQIQKEDEIQSLDHIATDEEIDGSLKINFQEMLGEESDGQISMVVNEKAQIEQQITGQMSIQDVLDEWEKTRRAAEAALQEAEQQKLESAKARALQEAGDIMERLNDVIPKLDAGVTPKELLEEEYLQNESSVIAGEIAQDAFVTEEFMQEESAPEEFVQEESVPEEIVPEESAPEEIVPEESAPEEIVSEESVPEEIIPEMFVPEGLAPEEVSQEEIITEQVISGEFPEITLEDELLLEDGSTDEEIKELENDVLLQPTSKLPVIENELIAEVPIEETQIQEPSIEEAKIEEAQIEDELVGETKVEESNEQFEQVNSFLGEEIAKITAENPEIEHKINMAKTRKMPSLKQKTARMPDISLPEDLDVDDEKIVEKHIDSLSEEQKAIFSYFIPVKGMEDQICKAFNGVVSHLGKKETASSGNLIIQGERGCGKTVLATSFIKVLQKENNQISGKIGKIEASALNKRDTQSLVRKISGGCLIIERAGELDRNTAVALSFLMEHDITGTLYILEDTSKGIKKALSLDEGFAAKFTEKISVPIFTNDELVLFAKSYSAELGYKIDEMAILALHNRISNIERIDQATTLTEVKEIVDEAIEREAHGGLKKAISILTAKRYTEDDRIVLSEAYFDIKK